MLAGMDFDGQIYWLVEGDNRVGPFCPTCLDSSDKRVRLADSGNDWECTVCNKFHVKAGSRGSRQTVAKMEYDPF